MHGFGFMYLILNGWVKGSIDGGEPGLYCKCKWLLITRKVTFFILMTFLIVWRGDDLLPPISWPFTVHSPQNQISIFTLHISRRLSEGIKK